MTSSENSLALCIIRENFGEAARSVSSLLISKKSYPLLAIANDLNLDKKQVAQILSVLVIHNFIEYRLNSKQLIEYKLLIRNVLNLLKYPLYIKRAEELGGKAEAIIVSEILLNGYVEMSSVVLKTVVRVAKEAGDKNIDGLYGQVRESFEKLVGEQYLKRLPSLDSAYKTTVGQNINSDKSSKTKSERIPKFANSDDENESNEKFTVPQIRIDDLRLLKAVQEDSETMAVKMRKLNENFGDNGIYWKVNETRFLQDFRDKIFIDAIEKRIDSNAAVVIKAILKLSDSKILKEKPLSSMTISRTVTLIDIQKELRSSVKMDSSLIDKYLSVIMLDSFKVLEKIGDFGGGAYAIDFKVAIYNMCLAHIESYIREKHGSKSLRIFRVVLDKSQLEQKQIEDFSMIPSKDCKALLYSMLNDGLLTITELSKTNDHAPSRTFYLFAVDIYQVCKKLLENAYKGMKNLIIKREFLNSENKRLLEKNKKINTIVDSLKAQGAEQAEIDDVKAMMSSEELKMLNCVNDHSKKIELAEIQLAETIFIFENFFYYHTTAPVIQAGRGSK